MESKKITKIQPIFTTIDLIKEKYFNQGTGILEEIKHIFINSKPMEPVLLEFNKRENAKSEKKKQRRWVEKKNVMRKVNQQIGI